MYVVYVRTYTCVCIRMYTRVCTGMCRSDVARELQGTVGGHGGVGTPVVEETCVVGWFDGVTDTTRKRLTGGRPSPGSGDPV